MTSKQVLYNGLCNLGVATVIVLGCIVIASALALGWIWLDHRDDAPACVDGLPVPAQGCVRVIK